MTPAEIARLSIGTACRHRRLHVCEPDASPIAAKEVTTDD